MNIAIIGSGYVGLVTGTCLAELGNHVTCIDVDTEKVARLSRGDLPIYEPGLEDIWARNRHAGKLHVSGSFEAVADSDVVFLCVGTPPTEDGAVDLSALYGACEEVAPRLREDALVVVKSTVPPGTWLRVDKRLHEYVERPRDWHVVSNPEFLKEGRAVEDFMRPERVVVGSGSREALDTMRKLYAPLLRNVGRFFETDNTTAELSKYATNAMLATRVSFINELALLCDEVGGDIEDVRQILGADSRIGPRFLHPSGGWGGSCWGKDLQGLCRAGEDAGVPLLVPTAALAANEAQRMAVQDRIDEAVGLCSAPLVAFWGVAFKPGTDDTRDSTAVWLAQQSPFTVKTYDPKAKISHLCEACPGPYDAARGADVLVLLTEWPEFKCPDFEKLREVMRGSTLIDTRNLWDPREVRSYGFRYIGMGRGLDRERVA